MIALWSWESLTWLSQCWKCVWSRETDAAADMPQVIRHHTVIVGVVSGLVLTVAILAVCATCHQSRRERRRLHKLSTTVTTATDVSTPTQQRAVDDVTGTGSASAAQNHKPHGWMGLANGGEYIQRDDGLSAASSGWTGFRRAPVRPHATITNELPVDDLAVVIDRTLSRGRKLSGSDTSNIAAVKHGRTSGQPAMTNTLISAVATIEKRPISPSTNGGREASTASPRPDVVQHEQFRYSPSRLARQAGESTSARWPHAVDVDTSPLNGRRICPGWSASVMPVVAAATGAPGSGRSPCGTLVRPNCLQMAPATSDRQWQRPASVRWTATGSSGRRRESSGGLSGTRSTSELYDDVRPRLGATHSIVF